MNAISGPETERLILIRLSAELTTKARGTRRRFTRKLLENIREALRETGEGRLVLVIGDIAFYHDMNGLLAAKRHGLDATIVVVNNDGGGIFSFLPQADAPEHFERLFGTPHGLRFGPAAALYGASHREPDTVEALRRELTASLDRPGLSIVELATDRRRNVALHREAWAAVARALDALPAAE